MSGAGPLWTCPKCGARFVNRNQWHSCGRATLDDWLRDLGPAGMSLYERFTALIGECGEFHVGPAKSRISFLARVRFANITKLTDDGMRCSLALPYRIESPRFATVDEPVPGWIVHTLFVASADELDAEVQDWIRASYRLMGMRERLTVRRGE